LPCAAAACRTDHSNRCTSCMATSYHAVRTHIEAAACKRSLLCHHGDACPGKTDTETMTAHEQCCWPLRINPQAHKIRHCRNHRTQCAGHKSGAAAVCCTAILASAAFASSVHVVVVDQINQLANQLT
jgi:hypothetical protein